MRFETDDKKEDFMDRCLDDYCDEESVSKEEDEDTYNCKRKNEYCYNRSKYMSGTQKQDYLEECIGDACDGGEGLDDDDDQEDCEEVTKECNSKILGTAIFDQDTEWQVKIRYNECHGDCPVPKPEETSAVCITQHVDCSKLGGYDPEDKCKQTCLYQSESEARSAISRCQYECNVASTKQRMEGNYDRDEFYACRDKCDTPTT